MRKVVKAKERKFGMYDRGVVEAHHLLPILLNKARRFEEAVQSAQQAIRREKKIYGKKGLMVVASSGELVKALYWTGEKRKSDELLREMFESSTNVKILEIV